MRKTAAGKAILDIVPLATKNLGSLTVIFLVTREVYGCGILKFCEMIEGVACAVNGKILQTSAELKSNNAMQLMRIVSNIPPVCIKQVYCAE